MGENHPTGHDLTGPDATRLDTIDAGALGPHPTRSDTTGPDVLVIGGGAAGVLVVAHLARAATRPTRVVVVDAGPGRIGAGTAYRTVDPAHHLNVRAGNLSAWHDDPDHFVSWLAATSRARPGDFATRARYGAYLAAVAYDAGDGPLVHVSYARCRATALTRDRAGFRVRLDTGAVLRARQVVLATGVSAPSLGWAPESLRESGRFVADPWLPGALDAVPAGAPVLFAGTGLTAVDLALSLARHGHPLTAVSRHGLLPSAHTTAVHVPLPVDRDLPTTLAGLRRLVRARIAVSLATSGDWRPAIDGLRPHLQRIWTSLDDADRAEFLRRDVRRWEVARHRMAPPTAERVAGLLATGQLTVGAGDVPAAFAAAPAGTWVVNATGPDSDPRRSPDPLIRSLLADGFARPGRLGIGLDTDRDGQLRDANGATVPGLWTLGVTRRGQLWESTAIPEIRAQAHALATRLAAVPARPTVTPARPTVRPTAEPARTAPLPTVEPTRTSTPFVAEPAQAAGNPGVPVARRSARTARDLYGLPLLTGARAANHYNEALVRVLRVQGGADLELQAALAEDPHFAMGHAALALLGHEGLADADAPASLAAAERAAERHADDRTRSFVAAVASRVRCRGASPHGPLLAHVRAYPRDALAVSACVPTIAFGGATEVPEEAWTIVEQLAPAYGTDWWYLGMLAFVRQEQHRWSDGADLADRALAAEPASGHAAHARTHVFYETADHVAGLRWLDDWMATDGRDSCYRAHFAWHAALHELALERATEARHRFHTQLCPPSVTGVRALVDAASLLWRCRLVGAWPDPLPIETVIASVPEHLFREPATAFIAMHAVLALAAAGDQARLDALRRYATGHPNPVHRDVVAPLAAALLAYVEERFDLAASTLAPLATEWCRLGGSDAQREVIDETLISALMRAGRCHEAETVHSARLTRMSTFRTP